MIDFDIESFVRKYMTKRPESLLVADFAKCADEMHRRIDGKRILVIGGAGTIGSNYDKAAMEPLNTRNTQNFSCGSCVSWLDQGGYPCEFFGSDTSGEKTFEEFYTDTDVKDEETFINVGCVKNAKKRPVAEVEAIFSNLRSVFAASGSTKADVIEVLKEYLPNFQHIEKGKSLDARM